MQRLRRAPDNELFDRGCDLVEAALAIRRLAGDPDSVRAVPSLLGCIETCLQELAAATTELEAAEPAPAHANGPAVAAADRRRRRGLTNLRIALGDAATASHAARALTARIVEAGAARRKRRCATTYPQREQPSEF